MAEKPEKLCSEHVDNLFSNLVNNPQMHCNDLVKIFCRLKPIETNRTSCITVQSEKTLRVNQPGVDESRGKSAEYSFNKIFSANTTQQAIYTLLSFPLLEDLVDGFNSVLFVYGLAGTEKNHTLIGTQADPGLLPRCLDTIFNTIANYKARKSYFTSNKANGFQVSVKETPDLQRLGAKKKKTNRIKKNKEKRSRNKDKSVFFNLGMIIEGAEEMNIFSVFISYVHIYKNNYYDLLDVKCPSVPEAKTTKRDAFHCVYVDNVTEIEAGSTSEVISLCNLARTRMIAYQASLGPNFVKGHSVFNIRLVQAKRNPNSEDRPRVSQLTIVDLYPWEKNCPEQHRKGTQEELENLQKCMHALHGDRDQMITPSNKYKLSWLFKQCFKGFTHINMLLCINCEENHYEEIQHALIFARDIKVLKQPKVSKEGQNQTMERKPPLVRWNFSNVVASTAVVRRMISTLDEMNVQNGPNDLEYVFLKRRLKDRMVDIRYENIKKMHAKKEARLLKKAQNILDFDKLTDNPDEYGSSADDDTAELEHSSKCVMNRQREVSGEHIEDVIRRHMEKINAANRIRDEEIKEIAKKMCNIDLATVQRGIQETLDGLKSRQEK